MCDTWAVKAAVSYIPTILSVCGEGRHQEEMAGCQVMVYERLA